MSSAMGNLTLRILWSFYQDNAKRFFTSNVMLQFRAGKYLMQKSLRIKHVNFTLIGNSSIICITSDRVAILIEQSSYVKIKHLVIPTLS